MSISPCHSQLEDMRTMPTLPRRGGGQQHFYLLQQKNILVFVDSIYPPTTACWKTFRKHHRKFLALTIVVCFPTALDLRFYPNIKTKIPKYSGQDPDCLFLFDCLKTDILFIRSVLVPLFQSHTILLVQPGKKPEGRTYSDYESVNECLEGTAPV